MSTAAPISFAGSQLAETRHVCAFFNSDDEEYRVLLPFIKDGFKCGHKAVHVVNPDQRNQHMQRLVAAGIDPATAERSGQLELRTNTETYLRDGQFDQGSNATGIRTNREWQCSRRISAEPYRLSNGLGG